MTSIPPGFRPFNPDRGFMDHVGPYYERQEADGSYTFGFQSDHRHVNMNGVFHGGVLLSFLDTIIGYIIVKELGCPCATVSFESKFIAGVAPGHWISGKARIRARTRTLAFTEGEAYVGEKLLLTASGVFRVFEGQPAP
jgi:acyl-coenzyme A thioesterase PaaI-like protein